MLKLCCLIDLLCLLYWFECLIWLYDVNSRLIKLVLFVMTIS